MSILWENTVDGLVTRAEAIILLLAQPDEPCLRRGYIYTQNRLGDADVLKRRLALAYVEHRMQAHADISCVVRSARNRYRLVRRA